MKKYLIGTFLLFITFFSGVKIVEASEEIIVDFNYSIEKSEFTVGEKGKITVEPVYDVTPKGTFKTEKNEMVDLKEDGSFSLLKAGKTELRPSFTLTKESEQEIKEAYMKKQGIKNRRTEDYELVFSKELPSLPITVSELTKTRDISYNFKVDTTSLKVGEKGKLSVEPLYGVNPKGQFKPEKNDFIDLKEDGTFTALKAGKTELKPTFTISEESVKEIDAAYVAQLEKPEEGDTSFPMPTIQQRIPIEISNKEKEKTKVPINFNFTASPDSLAVDASGKLTLANLYGVTPKGTFKAEKNDFIDLKEDGTFTGLKAGKTELKPVFTLSNDSIKEIKEAYIKQENKTDLTVDDIEFVYPDVQQIVAINVTEKAVTTPSSSTEKPSGTNKNLPKTSDSYSQSLVLLGVSTLVASVGALVIKRKLV